MEVKCDFFVMNKMATIKKRKINKDVSEKEGSTEDVNEKEDSTEDTRSKKKHNSIVVVSVPLPQPKPKQDPCHDLKFKLLNQLIVETKPITRLDTIVITKSKLLLEYMKLWRESGDRNRYEYCSLVLNSEEISVETWKMLGALVCNTVRPVSNDNMLDDILYLLNKYEFPKIPSIKSFIINRLLAGDTFDRITCYESNRMYYKTVMKCIHSIHKDKDIALDIRNDMIINLPPGMASDFTAEIYI